MINERGVTMISIAVTVIVMVILAAVTISISVGNNGTISQAKKASTASDLADEIEKLEFLMTKYNVSDGSLSISDFLDTLLQAGEIEAFFPYYDSESGTFRMAIKKNGFYFFIEKDGDYYGVSYAGDLGDIDSNYLILKKSSFNEATGNGNQDGLNQNGAYIYSGGENNSDDGVMNLVIFDSIEEAFCIQVRKGTLNMYVAEDITLTNSGLERSAIDIWPGARLNLYIESGKTLTVDSGKGKVGADSSTYAGPEYGGQGGYAGIHVPKNYVVADTTRDTYEASLKTNEIGEAVLTLQGDGILVAYGGNAGAGGSTSFTDGGSAGGGGAGAGIGGNGGTGGNSNAGGGRGSDKQSASGQQAKQGGDAFNGEDCGIIYIKGNLEVYAYGGGGGNGGDLKNPDGSLSAKPDAGAGAGGYPGAGIGGGGRRRRRWKSPIRCRRIFWRSFRIFLLL